MKVYIENCPAVLKNVIWKYFEKKNEIWLRRNEDKKNRWHDNLRFCKVWLNSNKRETNFVCKQYQKPQERHTRCPFDT